MSEITTIGLEMAKNIFHVHGVGEVSVTVHWPVARIVKQGEPVIAPGPALVMLTVHGVPAGAGTKPAPWSTSIVQVNVCVSLISFVPSGVIEILASIQHLTAFSPNVVGVSVV